MTLDRRLSLVQALLKTQSRHIWRDRRLYMTIEKRKRCGLHAQAGRPGMTWHWHGQARHSGTRHDGAQWRCRAMPASWPRYGTIGYSGPALGVQAVLPHWALGAKGLNPICVRCRYSIPWPICVALLLQFCVRRSTSCRRAGARLLRSSSPLRPRTSERAPLCIVPSDRLCARS
jgi:hypothetical protein